MQLPAEFIQKYQRLLGDQAPAFLAAFDGPVEKGFRINPNKTVTATMRAKMTARCQQSLGRIDQQSNLDPLSWYCFYFLQ
ncbi:hypothetical protein WP50_34990 [Lactiplantibacillus plantarum]|nr:hypothetical protein WP50_34990 [Lactiplantibacillus plantarum]